MKIQHHTVIGSIILSTGIILLVLEYYLDELAQRSAQSWYSVNCHTSCPVAPLPDYWHVLQPLIYFGITLCCIGIILLFGKILNDRMKSLQK